MKEEKRLDAIVIKSVDYGETDKLVTLLTKEQGKTIVRVRGVRKATSKLRYATQPFLHSTFILSPTKGSYVLVGCDPQDRFSSIVANLGAYYVACFVCEVADHLSAEEFEDQELFEFVLASLKSLNGDSIDDYVYFALRFLKDALAVAGHGLNTFFKETDVYFSYENGGFVSQKTPYCLKLSSSLSKATQDLISDVRPPHDKYAELFDLLAGYFNVNVQKRLHSHLEIVKMMDLL